QGGDSIIRIDPSGTVTTIGTGFTGLVGLAIGRSTSGEGASLFASQEGLSIDATDGDAIFEIRSDQCAAGTVNGSVGVPEDVLFVNGSAGMPFERFVTIAHGQRVNVELMASSAGPPDATYVLWAWPGATFHPTELSVGSSHWCTVNPTPFQSELSPQPIACVR